MSTDLPLKVLKAAKPAQNIPRYLNAFIGETKGNRRLRKSNDFVGGMKVGVKDNITTIDSNTTCASAFLSGYTSPIEAAVVDSMLYSGTAVVGKTNMDEFGMGSHSTNSYFGEVKNRTPNLSAGGSSGGSAVAVQCRNVDVALGTDTGGSVRLPAAYTGVVGFKPSYGLISRWGVVPYANSLDTVGILAANCNHVRRVLVRVRVGDKRDATCLSLQTRLRLKNLRHSFAKMSGTWDNHTEKIKIGVPLEYNIEELQDDVRDAWKRTLKMLQDLGHEIVPVSLPSTKQALSAYYVLAAAEAASNLAKYDGVRYGTRDESADGAGGVLYAATRGKGFGAEVKRRILLGSYTLSSEAIKNHFIQAQKVRRLVQRDFDRVFIMPNFLRDAEQFDLSEMEEDVALEDKLGPPQVDVLICPTAPTTPPILSDVAKQGPVDAYMNDVFTVPASLAGLPAISVPVLKEGMSANESPNIGIQVIGQYSDDFRVIDVGELIEYGHRGLPRPKYHDWSTKGWRE